MKQTVNVCDVIVKLKATCDEIAYETISVGNKKFDVCEAHATKGVRVTIIPEPKLRDLNATAKMGKGRVFHDAIDGTEASSNGRAKVGV